MKSQTTTWGVVSVLTVAGIVGMSTQSGNGHSASASPNTSRQHVAKPQRPAAGKPESDETRACDDIAKVLESFLFAKPLPRPESCVDPIKNAVSAQTLSNAPLNPNYVIALVPDPIHTHLALMFDRMTEVIQQAAQDENYSYEDSWLPWEDTSQNYALLDDDDQASNRTDLREDQPGILTFRRSAPETTPAATAANSSTDSTNKPAGNAPSKTDNNTSNPANQRNAAISPYREGLVVFIVGEDPTRGIHLQQFTNALEWIDDLNHLNPRQSARTVILGPTFSGSFSSLAKLLADGDSGRYLQRIRGQSNSSLTIYTGSANSGNAINAFDHTRKSNPTLKALDIDFHSFLERDEVGLQRYCSYLEQQSIPPDSIAIISEDETAYGGTDGSDPNQNESAASPRTSTQSANQNKVEDNGNDPGCLNHALWLAYPRDISALRAAYQTNSIFNTNVAQPSDVSRGRLPTDLADPEGQEHDTIRSYAGNQTPLSQEAYLLGLVNALRLHHSQHIVLRSTNPLDQLFLARYFRRAFPDARVVTDNSDRLFERDRGSSGMGGAMSLSTYPLLEKERDWVGQPSLGQRTFNADYSEGTYIAFRLLLHSRALRDDPDPAGDCTLPRDTGQFNPSTNAIVGSLPPLPRTCNLPVPLPDYGTPSWVSPTQCSCTDKLYNCGCRPATWLSVLGRDGFWAIAAINENTMKRGRGDHRPIAKENPAESPAQSSASALSKPSPDDHLAEIPITLKVWLLLVALFIAAHWWCCCFASFTAKPSFLTHFANPGTRRHTLLIFLGSFFAALMPLLAGWASGVFDPASVTLAHRWGLFTVVVVEAMVALSAGVFNVLRVARLGRDNGSRKTPPEPHLDSPTLIAAGCLGSVLALLVFFFAYVFPLQHQLSPANRLFTYYRSMHILSGDSPMIPLLFLTIGMYLWFWHSLHGLALFGPDRCRLPARTDLLVQFPGSKEPSCVLRMFSQEDAADPAEQGAKPLDPYIAGLVLILGLSIIGAVRLLARSLPVRSLGPQYYTWGFIIYFVFCISLLLAESRQLLITWARLRELLMFLDRTPLRRTLAALRGFSWGSVWGMSGNVLDVRYKLLSRQLESLGHTLASLKLATVKAAAAVQTPPDPVCIAELQGTHDDGINFARWYARYYRQSDAGNFELLETFQRSVAQTAGTLLVRLLLPEWQSEKDSLILDRAAGNDAAKDNGGSKDDDGSKDDGDRTSPPLSSTPYIRDAEEFVCLPYLGFVQNLLGRMRSMLLSMLFL
jgi:hypothetical protein